MEIFRFHRGNTPLLVSVPHCGTHVPDHIARRLTPAARPLPDTDWHVDRLYDFAGELGASVLTATHSRYVIDLNRPPDDQPLYPGTNSTGLCPATTFAGAPIYAPGGAPGDDEVARRIETYWRPYHDRIGAALTELRARHGVALLFEAHSIRSQVPRLFDGRLPDLNLGTAGGSAADPGLTRRLATVCAGAEGFSHVLNGRFTGGYITRAHGRPTDGVHAVQLELSQATYMIEDPPFTYLPERAETIRPVLRALLVTMLEWAAGREPAGGQSALVMPL